jgi:hypothetical protein
MYENESTTRKKILNRFETLMKSISDFKYTEINRMTIVDIDTVPFPSVFIYSGQENRLKDDRAAIGYENWDWRVFLEVWGENADMEEMLRKIHRTVFEDYTLGGNCFEAVRMGAEMWVVDPDRILTAMLIEYSVTYRHPLGIM